MKYMLMMSTSPVEGVPPTSEWTREEVAASWAHMQRIQEELTASGELVGGEGLFEPATAKTVVSDGVATPVVSDGPFPEAKEYLVGYWMVDVANEQRAIEIAARTSAAPGPGGRPTRKPIEVRRVAERPDARS